MKKWFSMIITSFILIIISLFSSVPLVDVFADEEYLQNDFSKVECWFDIPLPFISNEGYECGYVSVPLHHSEPDGLTIKIPVAVLRASSDNPFPDPLFLAQGGPGGDAFEVFPILISTITQELNRDIVIFNQRGTRYSEPTLLCDESFGAAGEILALPPDEADLRSLMAISDCYQRLSSEGIDLSAFNSFENAADVQYIRQALGYDEYNFYGVSYGTLLGLHLMRNHPEHLRSVVLDGVVPPNINFIPEIPFNTNRVFSNIINACSEDNECANRYPNLESRFFSLVDSLNEAPIRLSIKDPESGKRIDAYLNGNVLIDVLFQAFYLSDSYTIFPKLIENLEKGDYTFIQGIWPLFAFDKTLSEGMYFSVICAEDADFGNQDANVDGIRPHFAETASEDLQSYLDACDIWQVDLLPELADEAVVSQIPTLLLSGYFDPITPPQFADAAAQTLENSYVFVASTGSHGVAFDNECTNQILKQFLIDPQTSPDLSCGDDFVRSPIILADTISFPYLSEINQLSTSMFWQIGLASIFLMGILSSFIILPLIWLLRRIRSSREGAGETFRIQKWLVGLMALIFGMLALIFVSGVSFYTFQSLFNGLGSIFALSSNAAPFFLIPFFLIIITLGMIITTSIAWYKKAWSLWLRIYYSGLAICAFGYILVLAESGMMSVL